MRLFCHSRLFPGFVWVICGILPLLLLLKSFHLTLGEYSLFPFITEDPEWVIDIVLALGLCWYLQGDSVGASCLKHRSEKVLGRVWGEMVGIPKPS